MNIRQQFPNPVHQIDNVWIPLTDGTRLAARIWLPSSALEEGGSRPVPALLEYIPYRKNDWTAIRDALRHPYFAGHGYASIHVDLRGSGDSDGLLLDEYLPQEQDDALEVLAWIADQPWCNGRIGMFGKSWGGFNGLQIAARRPPQLKAIITIYSTDDRYADDVHYMGGAIVAYEMLPWAAVMLALNATPPDPRTVGERWRVMWLNRIEKTPAYIDMWLDHQRRDSYWEHGSVCENYAAIDIPVLAVGGWADGYTNPVFRLLQGLTGPKKGIIGPWAHVYPEEGTPEPSIGFLQESLRWWDYWLKQEETGIMDEPLLRAYLQESVPPQTTYLHRPGRWVGVSEWPPPPGATQTWAAADDGLLLAAGQLSQPQPVPGCLPAGTDTQAWCAFGHPGDYAPDQQLIDSHSLTFTTAPQGTPDPVLGFPELRCIVSADQPVAQLVVRLCDVAPDGRSTLVSYGVLNLTHRHSHQNPEPVVPGEKMTVTILLNAIGHTLSAGHRWRIALMPHYWPMIWPPPRPVTLTVFEASLTLPILADTTRSTPDFLPAETTPPLALDVLRPADVDRQINESLISGRKSMILSFDSGRVRFPDHHLIMEDVAEHRYTVTGDDPLSAEVVCTHLFAFEREDWRVRIETTSRMSSTATEFVVENDIFAFEGEQLVVEKRLVKKIPRDLQ